MRFYSIVIALVVFTSTLAFSQNNTLDTAKFNVPIDVENFQPELLNQFIVLKINQYRKSMGMDTLLVEQILSNAAEDQSKYMASQGAVDAFQGGKKKTTGHRVKYYGGSMRADELLGRASVSKGKELVTYIQAANEILIKWFSDEKYKKVFANPGFVLYGTGSALDELKKKGYFSIVFSNYQMFNAGAALREQMPVPYSKKKYGLKAYDAKICKKCDKFRNIESLQQGLFVKDNIIYFQSNNYAALKKLLKNPGDGLVVDVIQPSQYDCGTDNIVDFNRVNKGVMVKRISGPKMEKKNLITDRKQAKKKIEVMIGKLPKDITEPYELNLLVIKDKYVCKSITKTFTNEGNIVFSDPIELLADTVIIGESDYTPVAENSTLTFRIPFERNKTQYKKEDIEPLISKLQEPDFIIKSFNIAAYSSVEGSEEANKELQKKRAESIVSVIKERQTSDFTSKIETGDNINDFNRDVVGTEFASLAGKTVNEIQDYIRTNKLHKKMEPILTNHRYAEITMEITYEIGGKKEEPYVISRFNKAIKENNLTRALAIQKYIFRKVMKREYSDKAVFDQEIPNKPEYAGLLMNKLWLSGLLMNKLWLEKFLKNDELNEDYCSRIDTLYQMSPENHYIRFNHMYCRVLNEVIDNDTKILAMQKDISELYATPLKKATVDKLNLEYQFKVIALLDTLEEPHPLLLASLDTIRHIVGAKETNWQNALKLANLFIKHGDYEYAIKMLEPFINQKSVFEELVFTYIGLCTYTNYRIYTNNFAVAVEKALKLNQPRFCKLIKDKNLTIQVLENPKVKKMYCETCK